MHPSHLNTSAEDTLQTVKTTSAHSVNVHRTSFTSRFHRDVLVLVKVDSDADLAEQLTTQQAHQEMKQPVSRDVTAISTVGWWSAACEEATCIQVNNSTMAR